MPLDVLVRLKIGGQKPDLLPFRKTLQAIYHKGFAVRPLEIDPVKGAGEMALVATPYLALMIKPEGGKVHDFVNVVAGKDKKMAVGENRGGRKRHQIFVGRQVSCGAYPCASKPVSKPVSTSPLPPVAIPGLPVGLNQQEPSGPAIAV